MPSFPRPRSACSAAAASTSCSTTRSEYRVNTPYGAPSSPVMVGEIGGRSGRVPAAPRQGPLAAAAHDQLPRERVGDEGAGRRADHRPERLRLAAAATSSPGDFVICDQFVDRTWGRKDTFYDGPITTHVSSADPYCPTHARRSRSTRPRSSASRRIPPGTVVVIQGPRFSTRAESKWFASQGWEVINMTQYPECYLARELEICYCNISLITDHDAGTEGVEPVTNDEVVRVFNENNEQGEGAHLRDDPGAAGRRATASCAHALEGAAF